MLASLGRSGDERDDLDWLPADHPARDLQARTAYGLTPDLSARAVSLLQPAVAESLFRLEYVPPNPVTWRTLPSYHTDYKWPFFGYRSDSIQCSVALVLMQPTIIYAFELEDSSSTSEAVVLRACWSCSSRDGEGAKCRIKGFVLEKGGTVRRSHKAGPSHEAHEATNRAERSPNIGLPGLTDTQSSSGEGGGFRPEKGARRHNDGEPDSGGRKAGADSQRSSPLRPMRPTVIGRPPPAKEVRVPAKRSAESLVPTDGYTHRRRMSETASHPSAADETPARIRSALQEGSSNLLLEIPVSIVKQYYLAPWLDEVLAQRDRESSAALSSARSAKRVAEKELAQEQGRFRSKIAAVQTQLASTLDDARKAKAETERLKELVSELQVENETLKETRQKWVDRVTSLLEDPDYPAASAVEGDNVEERLRDDHIWSRLKSRWFGRYEAVKT